MPEKRASQNEDEAPLKRTQVEKGLEQHDTQGKRPQVIEKKKSTWSIQKQVEHEVTEEIVRI